MSVGGREVAGVERTSHGARRERGERKTLADVWALCCMGDVEDMSRLSGTP